MEKQHEKQLDQEISERENERCEKCGSKFNYIRLKTNERVCRNCGYVEKLEDQE